MLGSACGVPRADLTYHPARDDGASVGLCVCPCPSYVSLLPLVHQEEEKKGAEVGNMYRRCKTKGAFSFFDNNILSRMGQSDEKTMKKRCAPEKKKRKDGKKEK